MTREARCHRNTGEVLNRAAGVYLVVFFFFLTWWFYIRFRPGAHRSQGGLAIVFHFCVKKHTERSYVTSLYAFVRQIQLGLNSALAGVGFVPLGK